MNRMRGFYCAHAVSTLRPVLLLVLFAALFAAACGHGEQGHSSQAGLYSKGGLKMNDQLKFDARVQDSEEDGKKLIVNVNQDWVSAPPGMKERSLGQWYRMWLEAQGVEEGKEPKELQVVVRHEGDDLAKWSSEGYQIVTPRKDKDGESRSAS